MLNKRVLPLFYFAAVRSHCYSRARTQRRRRQGGTAERVAVFFLIFPSLFFPPRGSSTRIERGVGKFDLPPRRKLGNLEGTGEEGRNLGRVDREDREFYRAFLPPGFPRALSSLLFARDETTDTGAIYDRLNFKFHSAE